MKNKHTSLIWKTILPLVLCVLTVGMLLFFLIQLSESKKYFKDEAKTVAESYTATSAQSVEKSAEGSLDKVRNIAADLPGLHGGDLIENYGKNCIEKYGMTNLQFICEGSVAYTFGMGVGSLHSDEVSAITSSGEGKCSAIYSDPSLGMKCVAAYVPVKDNVEVDGIVAYYGVNEALTDRGQLNEHTKFYCLANSDGSIIDSFSAEGFKTDVSHNIYTYLLNLCDSKDTVDVIRKNCELRRSSTFDFNVDLNEYVVSCVTVDTFGSDCIVASVYSVKELIEYSYTSYDRLWGSAAGIIILTILSLTAFFVTKTKSDKQSIVLEEYDPILSCNTYNKFLRDATEILSQNRFSSYAIVYVYINKFSYVKEHFGAQMGDETLKYLSNVIKKTTTANETYGHVIDDRFVSLIHFSSMQELGDRIRLTQALTSNYGPTKSTDYTLKLVVGVYVIDREKDTEVPDMVERAIVAQKMNKKLTDKPYVVFDNSIRSDYLKEAEIESKMDTALKNREFKVFFQPKYNIETDKIDGAEALVRWYDAKANAYVGPDSFVPVFEVNGFISRLDKYVFDEVCMYLSESTARGEKVVPVSVNVSRVSATQPNFLSQYIEVKRNYKIPDDFITLEFTESFACENYDTIEKIVSSLKSNGFRCSIDDFGSGYSSLSILKELQMDELKLDKFFLKTGTNREKDMMLLQTIINLGKDFGMKVTQEGIETQEQLKALTHLGCDIIQGYYYSKPLPLSDFIDFIGGDTSMKAVTYGHAVKK